MLFQVTLLSIFLLAALPARCNDLEGCTAVDCPPGPGNGTSSLCMISNTTLNSIGLTSYSLPDRIDDGDLAWTLGISIHDDVNDDENLSRLVERIFYLGTSPAVNERIFSLVTSPSANLSSTDTFTACALFIRGSDNGNLIYDDSIPHAAQQPSVCQDTRYLGPDCVSSLQTSAADAAKSQSGSTSPAEACANIAEDMQSNLPNECGYIRSLNPVFTAVPLSGPDAPKPLTEDQNSTSDCYPTLPKSNDLTRVFSYNISASMFVNSSAPAIFGETPVMTLFYQAGNASTSPASEPNVQFVCLRPIDLTDAGEAAREDGDENSAYGRHDSASWVTLASGAVAVLLSFAFT